jgi:thiamine biosynthesis lipoprotein
VVASTPAPGAAAATRAVAVAESVVDVMGTRAHVVVHATDFDHADVLRRSAVARLHALEAKWSRFRPDSEISRINADAGRPVDVSRETSLLVERSVEAWARTQGRFDPTVLPALRAAGYDRDFADLGDDTASTGTTSTGTAAATPAGPAPGCDGITVRRHTVALPAGVALDPGGIGKGLAADLVADLVMTAGALGVCVNVGGDLRVAGRPEDAPAWTIRIEDPLRPGTSLGAVTLTDEALVSSWRTRRTWMWGGRRVHHLIDPRTGEPAWSGTAGVSVVAGDAWWAEALATSLFLLGPDAAPGEVTANAIEALVVRDDGARRGFGRFAPLAAASMDRPA